MLLYDEIGLLYEEALLFYEEKQKKLLHETFDRDVLQDTEIVLV